MRVYLVSEGAFGMVHQLLVSRGLQPPRVRRHRGLIWGQKRRTGGEQRPSTLGCGLFPCFMKKTTGMVERNRHGLTRHIPADIKREIRRRSKFACVICRSGFYQYEHIDPLFVDAKEHNPDCICCLCASCHDAVSRGHRSKASVVQAYRKIEKLRSSEVKPPVGPLDFHDGSAELLIGGLKYSPVVHTVLRYEGQDLIKVVPGFGDEPGKISATFTTEGGEVALRLDENEWIGSLDVWDTDVVGSRLTVRRKKGDIALQLNLVPPGRIVVEHLEMRYRDAYVLASDSDYVVGRERGGNIFWMRAEMEITGSSIAGAAIEFADPDVLEARRQRLAPGSRGRWIIGPATGVAIPHLGMAVATQVDSFFLGDTWSGACEYEEMRAAFFRRAGSSHEYSVS